MFRGSWVWALKSSNYCTLRPMRDHTETWPGCDYEGAEESPVDRAYDLLGFSTKFPSSLWQEISKICPAGIGHCGQGLGRFKPALGTWDKGLGGQAERNKHRDHFKPLWSKSDPKVQRGPLQDSSARVVPHLPGSKLKQLAIGSVHRSRAGAEEGEGRSSNCNCNKPSFLNQNYFLLLHLYFLLFNPLKFCCFFHQ